MKCPWFQLSLLLVASTSWCACGGSDPPPEHPPKPEAVHPTVEKPPPVPSAAPHKP